MVHNHCIVCKSVTKDPVMFPDPTGVRSGKRARQWANALDLDFDDLRKRPLRSLMLCRAHFRPSDYNKTFRLRRLSFDAVPRKELHLEEPHPQSRTDLLCAWVRRQIVEKRWSVHEFTYKRDERFWQVFNENDDEEPFAQCKVCDAVVVYKSCLEVRRLHLREHECSIGEYSDTNLDQMTHRTCLSCGKRTSDFISFPNPLCELSCARSSMWAEELDLDFHLLKRANLWDLVLCRDHFDEDDYQDSLTDQPVRALLKTAMPKKRTVEEEARSSREDGSRKRATLDDSADDTGTKPNYPLFYRVCLVCNAVSTDCINFPDPIGTRSASKCLKWSEALGLDFEELRSMPTWKRALCPGHFRASDFKSVAPCRLLNRDALPRRELPSKEEARAEAELLRAKTEEKLVERRMTKAKRAFIDWRLSLAFEASTPANPSDSCTSSDEEPSDPPVVPDRFEIVDFVPESGNEVALGKPRVLLPGSRYMASCTRCLYTSYGNAELMREHLKECEGADVRFDYVPPRERRRKRKGEAVNEVEGAEAGRIEVEQEFDIKKSDLVLDVKCVTMR